MVFLNMMVVAHDQYAAAFFSKGLAVNDLVKKYDNTQETGKIKILIVPGHEPAYGGTEYNGLVERDLNVQLADELGKKLKANQNFEVIFARDKKNWNPLIRNFVADNFTEIKNWRDAQEKEMGDLTAQGLIKSNQDLSHNSVPGTSAIMLYGINKWAGDNKVDITIHVHFNDNPKVNGKPKYEGFAIYVPEAQYSNSSSSVVLAQDLMAGLKQVSKVSNFKKEAGGVVEDQDLIAIGRFNTADSLAALIEYKYIYEKVLQAKSSRDSFITAAASSTASAIVNFFTSRSI